MSRREKAVSTTAFFPVSNRLRKKSNKVLPFVSCFSTVTPSEHMLGMFQFGKQPQICILLSEMILNQFPLMTLQWYIASMRTGARLVQLWFFLTVATTLWCQKPEKSGVFAVSFNDSRTEYIYLRLFLDSNPFRAHARNVPVRETTANIHNCIYTCGCFPNFAAKQPLPRTREFQFYSTTSDRLH